MEKTVLEPVDEAVHLVDFSVLITGSSAYPRQATSLIESTIRSLESEFGDCFSLRIKSTIGYSPDKQIAIRERARGGQALLQKVVKGNMNEDQIRAAGLLMTNLIKIEMA